jgi:hypothetical protein
MEYPYTLPVTLSGCAHYLREPGTDNSINFQRKKHLTGSNAREMGGEVEGDGSQSRGRWVAKSREMGG